MRLDYGGYADFHKDYDEYDVIDQAISFEPQFFSGKMIYSFPLVFNHVHEDGNTDYIKYMASPTATYIIPDLNHAIGVNGTIARIADKDSIDIDEDANILGGGLAYYALFKNKSSIKVSIEYQHASYDSKISEYGVDLSGSQKNRKDNIWAGALNFEFPLLDNLGLFASYSHIYSRSNVDIYGYSRNIIESGLAIHY